MVLRYSCHDGSVLPSLGKSSFLWNWLVQVGGGSVLDLRLTAETNIIGAPVVSLSLDGKSVFPPPDTGKEKAKLREDLIWECPFRASVPGIGELHRFEMRPEHGREDEWYPATITRQREGGYFEVKALLPGTSTQPPKEVHFPALRAECIRDAETKAPVSPDVCSLVLRCPCKEPKAASLILESPRGRRLMTHFFARHSPPFPKDPAGLRALHGRPTPPRIRLSQSKDRSTISCSVGHTLFEEFLACRATAGEQRLEEKRVWWNVNVGPFASHAVEVERRYLLSPHLTLLVDGELLCEASAEDLECSPESWDCSFRFVGEQFLDWDLFEQTPSGADLHTRGIVSKRTAYAHEVVISVPTSPHIDVKASRLAVDGKAFCDLPRTRPIPKEPNLVLAPEALQGSYGLEVPVKHGKAPPSFIGTVMSSMGLECSAGNSLLCCGSNQSQAAQYDTVVPQTRHMGAPGLMMDAKVLFPMFKEEEPPEVTLQEEPFLNEQPEVEPAGAKEPESAQPQKVDTDGFQAYSPKTGEQDRGGKRCLNQCEVQ